MSVQNEVVAGRSPLLSKALAHRAWCFFSGEVDYLSYLLLSFCWIFFWTSSPSLCLGLSSFVRKGDVPENTWFAAPEQAEAEDWATFAAPEGLARSADAPLALGSPKAAVAQPSGHRGFSSMGMLRWTSMSYTPLLIDRGAGCIPPNGYFRQELEVPGVKTYPENQWDRCSMPSYLFITVDFIEQLPVLAWYLLVLVRKTLLLEWAGKLGVQKQMVVLFWTHWGEQWGCTAHGSQRPVHWMSSLSPPELCQRVRSKGFVGKGDSWIYPFCSLVAWKAAAAPPIAITEYLLEGK